MTNYCEGVKLYNCPYGNFCKAKDYKTIFKGSDLKSKEGITRFLDNFTNENPIWIRDTNIYSCKPKLNEKDLNQLLNEIDGLE